MKTTAILSALLALLGLVPAGAQEYIDLSGPWDFQIETRPDSLPIDRPQWDDYILLPGSMTTAGKGDPVSVSTRWTGSLYDSSFYFNPYMAPYRKTGQMKLPFFLTPERHYVGPAWYRRRVYVPANWDDRRVTLLLERPHIETKAYVNGHEVGRQLSLSTPHRYDVTAYIQPGAANEIAVRVYNGIENVGVGQDSHSVSDQTQGNWNGITGRIELQAQWERLGIEHVTLRPDLDDRGRLNVEVRLDKHLYLFGEDHFFIKAIVRPLNADGTPGKTLGTAVREVTSHTARLSFNLGGRALLWDEFQPQLYELVVLVGDDEYHTTFGLRHVAAEGRQLTINGRPLFLRGTVGSCCFPETGYPPTDVQPWLDIFAKVREYGLNHVRFHSYCPPEAAFQAADRLGVYLQVEGPSWPNHGVALRRGQIIDDYLLQESRRIIDEYGHHPSFLFMAAGNEPAGDWVSYCRDWVSTMHQYDPTKLYCGASVGGGWAWDDGSEYHVKGGARGLDWGRHAPSSDDDYYDQIRFPRNYRDSVENRTPIVAHEQGQWCAFPDLSETSQYTGAYRARNFEVFADLLSAGGMAAMADSFLMASGRLQTLCYKYEIERNLRTRDYAGFQLLGLNDYSGQGSAIVGPLNVHWREKGYVSAPEWREFCNYLVPLARFPRFVYTDRDTLRVPVGVYNAFRTRITQASAVYYIINADGLVLRSGVLSDGELPMGKTDLLGTVELPLAGLVDAPAKLTLQVRFSSHFKNHWDFWVYPEAPPRPSPVGREAPPQPSPVGREAEVPLQGGFKGAITDDYRQALRLLSQGRTVLLLAAGHVSFGRDVVQHYLPVFWNTSWFKMRPPHTTGAYIERSHPLFSHGFPTDSWANLNWWELLNGAQVMNLSQLPADYQSPVQPIDTWHVSRKLGMIVEARVGRGLLLMTTLDVSTDLDRRHVARQLRRALLDYMGSADFRPTLTLTPDQVGHFFTHEAQPVNMFTNDSPDELKPKLK